jgi:hypothetical protein
MKMKTFPLREFSHPLRKATVLLLFLLLLFYQGLLLSFLHPMKKLVMKILNNLLIL